MTDALVLDRIDKRYGPFWALRNVSARFEAGKVHALLGENGAGKSTLIKIIAGVIAPSAGTVVGLSGAALKLASPRDALKEGIAVVHQELDLFEDLSIAENIALRPGQTSWLRPSRREMRQQAISAMARLDASIEVDRRVGDLDTSVKQIVAIAKAVDLSASVLVLDEPTSALLPSEVDKLLATIRKLRQTGMCIIYVSHKMPEVFAIADTVTVVRDGLLVHHGMASEVTPGKVTELMLGRSVSEMFSKRMNEKGDTILELRQEHPASRTGTISVSAGEIVALMASDPEKGSALLNVVAGGRADPNYEVLLDGGPVKAWSIKAAIKRGIGRVPADRLNDGIIRTMSVAENGAAVLNANRGRTGDILAMLRRLKVPAKSYHDGIATLSGGNQQKTILARWLVASPRLLLLDDPTRGVDIGAKHEIYQLLQSFVAEGGAILMTTTDALEVSNIVDRVIDLDADPICRA